MGKSAIPSTTHSPPAAFPLLFWTIIICLLVAILLLQIITMTKSAHLAMRTSRKGQSHPRRQRAYQGTGQGVELKSVRRHNAPLIHAFPEPLAVNSRPATVGVCSGLSFHQQLNRQWALAEHAAQPDQLEIVNDRVAAAQLEVIQEEENDDDEF